MGAIIRYLTSHKIESRIAEIAENATLLTIPKISKFLTFCDHKYQTCCDVNDKDFDQVCYGIDAFVDQICGFSIESWSCQILVCVKIGSWGCGIGIFRRCESEPAAELRVAKFRRADSLVGCRVWVGVAGLIGAEKVWMIMIHRNLRLKSSKNISFSRDHVLKITSQESKFSGYLITKIVNCLKELVSNFTYGGVGVKVQDSNCGSKSWESGVIFCTKSWAKYNSS